MKKLLIPILLLLTSCGGIGISKIEKEAVEKVVLLYGGGEYNYRKTVGFKNTTRENTFELEISGCPVFKNFEDDLQTVASGMAYNLFNELGDSRKKYDLIKIHLKTGGEVRKFDYPMKMLREVEDYRPQLNKTVEQLMSNNYTDLYNQIEHEDTNVAISLDDTKMICDMADSLFGDFKDFSLFSFMYAEYPDVKGEYLQLSTTINGTKGNGLFIVIINPDNKKIAGFRI